MNREIKERTKWFMDARFGDYIQFLLVANGLCLKKK